jgi:hypothetical protein
MTMDPEPGWPTFSNFDEIKSINRVARNRFHKGIQDSLVKNSTTTPLTVLKHHYWLYYVIGKSKAGVGYLKNKNVDHGSCVFYFDSKL